MFGVQSTQRDREGESYSTQPVLEEAADAVDRGTIQLIHSTLDAIVQLEFVAS
jgi:hypothetical protein